MSGLLNHASKMFESTVVYESGPQYFEDFPKTDNPVWILGKAYSALYDLPDLKQDISSKLWFSYRKNFWPIGGVGPTSDTGWGCMLRCGQMVLAEALIRRHLGSEWKWSEACCDPVYAYILSLFQDKKDCYYSIHHIAQMGASEGKEVGQWLGPNTIAQVLKKLARNEKWSSIVIHVALDNTVVTDDIRSLCRVPDIDANSESGSCRERTGKISQCASGSSRGKHKCPPKSARSVSKDWRPLVLFIPLRLGLTELNPVYSRALKTCFTLKQSLGIIGGRPNHAYYFIGAVDNELIYLDPHTTQPVADIDWTEADRWAAVGADAPDASYHCTSSGTAAASRMDVTCLDPSVALAFYAHTEQDFSDLCRDLHKKVLSPEPQPMFELCHDRPPHWGSLDCDLGGGQASLEGAVGAEGGAPGPSGESSSRHYDTDEEYELL